MATKQIGLSDIRQGGRPSRLKLLAPLRYLAIRSPEKSLYDFKLPLAIATIGFLGYFFVVPSLPIFGEAGLLRFARDLLIMALPFMVGCLAAVAMAPPGLYIDRRPVGVELFLDGRLLSLRQFVCYLLGYLCFVAFVTLIGVVGSHLLHDTVVAWLSKWPTTRLFVHVIGIACLSILLAVLSITVLWALYFLTDIVNRPSAERE